MGDPAPSCAKCGTLRDEARTACAKCGLAHDKSAAFAKASVEVPDALGAAWEATVAGWDEAPRHDELLRLVTTHDAYAWAASRYRERVAANPDDALGQRHLERVRRAAEAALLTTGTARVGKVPTAYRSTMAILAVLVLFTIIGFVYAVVRRQQIADPPASAPVAPSAPAKHRAK